MPGKEDVESVRPPSFCPKCGAAERWEKPKFKSKIMLEDFRVVECLSYKCGRCGYVTSVACEDAKE